MPPFCNEGKLYDNIMCDFPALGNDLVTVVPEMWLVVGKGLLEILYKIGYHYQ